MGRVGVAAVPPLFDRLQHNLALYLHNCRSCANVFMSDLEANKVVDQFAAEFEAVLAKQGATLLRLQYGHSDRSFLIVRPPGVPRFVAKLSQSPSGCRD